MNTPSREDLLGFLLGALEADERQQVADCLRQQPELQHELLRIKTQLAPLDGGFGPPTDFPAGLARRTCERIARGCRAPHATSAPAVGGVDEPVSPVVLAPLRDPPARSPRRVFESTALVCCAAVLGALLGPIAMTTVQRSSSMMAASPPPTGARIAATDRLTAGAESAVAGLASEFKEVREQTPESNSFLELRLDADLCDAAATQIPVGRWNDWRGLAGESLDRQGLEGEFSVAAQIGQGPFLRSRSPGAIRSAVALISN